MLWEGLRVGLGSLDNYIGNTDYSLSVKNEVIEDVGYFAGCFEVDIVVYHVLVKDFNLIEVFRVHEVEIRRIPGKGV